MRRKANYIGAINESKSLPHEKITAKQRKNRKITAGQRRKNRVRHSRILSRKRDKARLNFA